MPKPLRLALSLAILVVGAAACTTPDTDDEAAPSIVTPTEVAEDAEVAQPTPEGRIENPFSLEVGDCFNEYVLAVEGAEQETREITTVVDCRRPHDGEIYASHVHPADASVVFPGNVDMNEWAVRACYESFEAFVGAVYELSALEIGVIHPNEETWSDPVGLHREVLCYVHAPDGQLSGPMRDSGI